MKIKAGNFEVLGNGTVISFNLEPLKFYIPPDLEITFLFRDDGKNVHRMEFNSTSNNSLEITLVNFNNPLGTGTTQPIHVATLNGNPLYLNFRIYTLDASSPSKTIHYTWYLGKEVKNG